MSNTNKKHYTSSPLPFQGQKRHFLQHFAEAVEAFPNAATIVDLFGGSGLLAHIAKRLRPDARTQPVGRLPKQLPRQDVLQNGSMMERNKYYAMLNRILSEVRVQNNKKGAIQYLLNEQLHLTPADLLDIFEGYNIARRKLKNELQLFMQGERNVAAYREAGIGWWDYCGQILVNSYPTYFEKLPPLVAKINREQRNSKNYVLFLGATDAESNQHPRLSLVQFQIDNGQLVLSAYQRSSDANLGLPADIYHLYLMARQIHLPLQSVTLNLANVHVYENNLERTRRLLAGDEDVRFDLNV